MRSVVVASVVLALGVAARFASAAYTAIDLYALTMPAEFRDFSFEGAAAGQVVGSGGPPGHGLLWNSSGAPVDLNPSAGVTSDLLGTNGVQQVGFVISSFPYSQAFRWTGTPESAVNLNPPGSFESLAWGTSGTQQVGWVQAQNSGPTHATLWSGSASSAVDLNPAGSARSFAYGTDGVHQVGYVFPTSAGVTHAALWSGTADSAVDLSPANLPVTTTSLAFGVGGDQQVGWATIGTQHAFLWRGTPELAVDLNPLGAIDSTAYSTNGTQQAGWMHVPGMIQHAIVWSGTADSAVDLNLLLPAGWTNSAAFEIDSQGNVFGTAVERKAASDVFHAVEWQNVPEPASAALLLVGAPILLRRRRSK